MEITKNKWIMIQESSFVYNEPVNNQLIAIDFLKNVLKLQEEAEEVMILVGLNCKNNMVMYSEVARGTIDATITTPREILKRALLSNCSKILIAHNHPSGIVKPSSEDRIFTNQLKNACEIMEVELIDHIIIGNNHYSFLENNEL